MHHLSRRSSGVETSTVTRRGAVAIAPLLLCLLAGVPAGCEDGVSCFDAIPTKHLHGGGRVLRPTRSTATAAAWVPPGAAAVDATLRNGLPNRGNQGFARRTPITSNTDTAPVVRFVEPIPGQPVIRDTTVELEVTAGNS